MKATILLTALLLFVGCGSLGCSNEEPEGPRLSTYTAGMRSTVLITVTGPSGVTGKATGVAVATLNGRSLIASAGHVYSAGATYEAEDQYGLVYPIIPVGVSDEYDVMLFWVAVELPPATRGELPAIGDEVMTLGNRLGDGLWPMFGHYAGAAEGWARCSGPAHPGVSGGGVWHEGKLIGLVSCVAGQRFQIFPSMTFFSTVQALRGLEVAIASSTIIAGQAPAPYGGPGVKNLPPSSVKRWR